MNQTKAFIHPKAKIGKNVIIDPFAYIDEDVIIEDNCWIGPHACIWNGARISSGCKIFPGAQISCLPQDLKYKGEITETFIGENTTIREFATISKGTSDKYLTSIGKNCLLMAYVHIAHDCIVGDNVIMSNSVQLAGHVTVDDHTVIGGTTIIRQFAKVGKHAMIVAGSKIGKDIPPFVTAGREPVAYCGINAIGLKRRNFSKDKIDEIQDIYRTIYLSELNTTNALEKISESYADSEIKDEIINFVKNSKLGIMKGLNDQ